MQGLIRKLLNLTHSHWIFRHITKYHHRNGMVKLNVNVKQDIMKEIKTQLDMGLCNLSPESKCLLEIDTLELLDNKIKNQ